MKLESIYTKYPELNRELLEALVSKLKNEPYRSPLNGEGQKLSIAIAYADLLLDSADDVTEYHKNMLKKYFSDKEIDSLSRFLIELQSHHPA
ncbi:MAG TPA: hypothetical protein DDY13_06930 [Cytophagales bacterium]|jgi:hypothetical protein|nr:hypothetical protein [Cytophagales bacterium]